MTIDGVLKLFAVLGVLFGAVSFFDSKLAENKSCAKKCDTYRSKIIENECFCKTTWGWEKR